MILEKRTRIDRRSGKNRRKEYVADYFLNGGQERRSWEERRVRSERRKGWERVSEWSSVFVEDLHPKSQELLVERRTHKRFYVRDDTFALFGSHSAKVGQIVDISKSGLAFRYVAGAVESNGSFEIDIFLSDNSFYLEKIPVQTISDLETANETPSISTKTWRRGMQFGVLTQNQTSEINYFITNHTTGEV